MKWTPYNLVLEDGSVYSGVGPGWQTERWEGEVVFNTGMTGYFESLTDPSYAGQHLLFTYPLLGNYGVQDKDKWESNRIHAKGVLISEVCIQWSHSKGVHSFLDWLAEQKVPLISGLDTRHLTKKIRTEGAMLGSITKKTNFPKTPFNPNNFNIVAQVSTDKPKLINEKKGKKIVVVDCGMKLNILRCLQRYPLSIHHVPYNYNYLEDDYDGIFISNGPGNPENCTETIEILRHALKKDKPIFGICLGAQILSLAAGAKTYKLPFGHRGHNQPCMNLETNNCYVTSQNHGYAIDENSLPKGWVVSYRNLNDGTVEGIRHNTRPHFAVQFHPEACPGPTDTDWIFEDFISTL